MTFREFLKHQFDKFLLAGLFLFLLWHGADAWHHEQASLILGALIGLITGVKAGIALERLNSKEKDTEE
jgi:hypothetical protein